ncbi:tellurite resistance TerB family protein [Pseudorhodoplanes sinuspersici]|uniref:Uncharacterized protein n=1 Tax=Pseudorhodoplanes sinuspersici TaxID=1235591 RepID=A0A1W6ZND7_9HYPH|nr:tellurite resistance TerB family protein [Pseudorhodoplanes sinuspersici]ARP98913.1 hypothetical protein CAK95_07345 [Pseudorhodoplanes sinuspersici]RKE69458.1 uncharacterized membrane protein YebE (DUF533 family) [Pseudorhodoplanes sinuspersici]
MLDAKRLLDQFMGAPSQHMPDHRGGVPQQQQSGPQRGVGDMVGGLSNGLGNMLGSNLGGIGGGALAGGLAALLMGSKSGRRMAGSALQLGGMAVVGALAYKAYQNWQSGKTVTQSTVPSTLPPPPADTPFLPAREAEQQSLSRHLLRAMIAAAKSDGHVDAKEQAAIFAEMDKLPLDADDKAFVIDEMRRPLDVDAVADAARTPEEAASIYTASLLAIDVDNPSERAYLGLLAARLNLDDALVKHLHASVEGATVPAKDPAMAR